ncbi:S8 family serine peptidase [Flavobacteriaceae bacterium XHP0103]|uniref:S8 family serine peptidase n=1 Tax=Marixanthotalea marina TaxID=2844359 RepID=UPI00298A0030|nr:S8 family serine peptidase [Marixanthotalea marina]MBU3821362.1 S8 family serine peptidase [Marixanthotalea marina]
MKIKLTTCFLLCFQFVLFAQQDAWVYLKDKQNVADAIANPITILTQNAIDRKNTHGVAIDERDVPVNENYMSQLKSATGILVKAKSKWLNAVHVRGSQNDIEALINLDFVVSIDFADKSLNTSKTAKQKTVSKLENVDVAFNYGSASNQIEMIKGDKLHLQDYTGLGMTVAVLDAGFPNVNTIGGFKRLRDAGRILGTYDFVDRDTNVYSNTTSNHGTLVLSTMAGYIENQFVGTAPDASYYLFVTEDGFNENPVEESYWVEAAERADSLGVDVINSSLGYGSFYDNPNYNYPASSYDGNTAYITKGANIAFEKGLLIVNSAGNEGTAGINAPADAVGVFSIGAVNASGNYASFSSRGNSYQPTQKPDVVAQGQNSYVITENNSVATANGTSFSSPIMAGGIVCLWQALPNKSNVEIMQLVRESASQYNNPDNYLGYGISNLEMALNSVIGNSNESTFEEIVLYPNPSNNIVYVGLPENTNIVSIRLFDFLGRKVNDFSISNEYNSIDVSSLSSGLYIARIESGNEVKAIKLIKK